MQQRIENMAKYAYIQNGSVEEFRHIDDITKIATHKKAPDGCPLLRPVIEGETPKCRGELGHVLTDIDIGKDVVKIRYTIANFPREQQQAAVKLEANRRILERFPQWKQINMVARGMELENIRKEKGTWTNAEYAEIDTLSQAWGWIKSVRDASNKIEQLKTIPYDYDDNARWPK